MTGLTAVRARVLMGRRPVTRAADVDTGAMVALVPSTADAGRLVVDGGEPAEQLHATLVYLGDAADYLPYVRELLYGIVAAEAEDLGPIAADGFSVSLFNPGTEDVCVVLGLSGGDLGAINATVTEKVAEALALVDVDMPEQHEPYVPHVTIVYGDDPAVIKAIAGNTGPVTFDRIRLAFGGDVIDIPLGSPAERADWTVLDDLDEETQALIEALSRFDADPSRAEFDSAEHPRIPKGKPGGGRFLSIADRIEKAINDHHAGNGHGDPFAGFNREQLRKAAKAKGITLKRGASQDDIAKALLDHTGHKDEAAGPSRPLIRPPVSQDGAQTRRDWEADEEFNLGKLLGAGATAQQVADAKDELARQLREAVAGRDIAARVSPGTLLEILKAGRFKSQFETKTSTALYDPALRAEVEDAMFGIPLDSDDPGSRPIYGYVDMGQAADDPQNALDAYGAARVVFKPAMRDRTTISVGDSLMFGILPSPIDNPDWLAANPGLREGLGIGLAPMDYAEQARRIYIEAQLHGGVSTDDIERVVLPSQPSATLQAALTRRGIPWEVMEPKR